jgi:hypothetical protein
MAYAVAQRSNALGASTGYVLRFILGQGLRLAGFGLALGLAAAVAGTRLLTTMLFQVQPNDPWVYLAVTALLGGGDTRRRLRSGEAGIQNRSVNRTTTGISATERQPVSAPRHEEPRTCRCRIRYIATSHRSVNVTPEGIR